MRPRCKKMTARAPPLPSKCLKSICRKHYTVMALVDFRIYSRNTDVIQSTDVCLKTINEQILPNLTLIVTETVTVTLNLTLVIVSYQYRCYAAQCETRLLSTGINKHVQTSISMRSKVFTARSSYASAVLRIVILSIRPSISLSIRDTYFVTKRKTTQLKF